VGRRKRAGADRRPFLPNVEVAAICDVDENLFPARLLWFEQNDKPAPKTYVDIRKLLEDKSIDAISVATPNHWHALAGVWACQAGKHAHIEKPFTHNVFEGQKLIEAARKYKRIVHHGTESRSSKAYQEAMEFMRNGGLGEVYLAKGTCYKWRDTIRRRAGPRRRPLRSLARPCTEAALLPQPLPLQLALALGLRQR